MGSDMTTQRTPRFGRTRVPLAPHKLPPPGAAFRSIPSRPSTPSAFAANAAKSVSMVCLAALLVGDAVAHDVVARTWRDKDNVDRDVEEVMMSQDFTVVAAGEFVTVVDPDVDKHPLDNRQVTATFRLDEVFKGEEALAGDRVIEMALWSDTLAYPGEEVSRREKRERLLAPYYEKRWAIEAQIKVLDVTEGLDPEARARARRELVAQRDAVQYPLPRGLRESQGESDWVDGGIRLGTPYVVVAELPLFSKDDPDNTGYRKWIAGSKAAAMIPMLRTFWARQSGGWFPYYPDFTLVDFAASDGREFAALQFRLYPQLSYVGDTHEERPQDFRTQTVRLRENGYPQPFGGAFGEAPEAMFERLHAQALDLYDAAALAAAGAAKFVPWRRFEVGGQELAVNVKEVPPDEDLPHRSSFASRVDYPGLWQWRVRHFRAVADAKLVSFGERRFLVVYWIECERYCSSELRSVELTTVPRPVASEAKK